MKVETLAGLKAGLGAALEGMRAAATSSAVRRAYVQLVGVLLAATLLLDAAGIWLVVHFTESAPDASWWAQAGLVALRVLGVLVALLAAPFVALVGVHVGLPLLAERLFLAALREIDAARAEALERGPGLPVVTSALYSVRRLARYLVLVVLAFLVGFVPLIGWLVAPVLQFLLSTTSLASELLDPWFGLAGRRWADQRALLVRHRPALVGFATPPTLLLLVPIVGPLFFGLAQAATAQLVARVLEPQPEKSAS
jgi:CysZ protein